MYPVPNVILNPVQSWAVQDCVCSQDALTVWTQKPRGNPFAIVVICLQKARRKSVHHPLLSGEGAFRHSRYTLLLTVEQYM